MTKDSLYLGKDVGQFLMARGARPHLVVEFEIEFALSQISNNLRNDSALRLTRLPEPGIDAKQTSGVASIPLEMGGSERAGIAPEESGCVVPS